jgi:hypothetical protein
MLSATRIFLITLAVLLTATEAKLHCRNGVKPTCQAVCGCACSDGKLKCALVGIGSCDGYASSVCYAQCDCPV